MFSTCKEARDEINKVTECATNDLSTTTESIKGDMDKIVKELHTATTRTENQDESLKHTKGMGTTYADALNRQFPTSHAGTLARSHARNRQVLVDKAPDTTANHLDNLDEGKLVEKANEAITKMCRTDTPNQTEVKVIGVKRLQNGGVVYDLNNPEAATWLHKEKTDFTKHFGGASVIKDKKVSVIAKYIPIAHNTDVLGENRIIK